jgi:DNA-binding IclR family transcriptional regulator
LEYSPKAIHAEMGMPESTCRDQFKVLVEKGYLVPKHEGSNIFDFYEKPNKKA